MGITSNSSKRDLTLNNADLIIVGAGLAGLITAWRCLDVNPDLTITIIDEAEKIGGDHTWSFNLSDVPVYLEDWIKPFIAYQWPRYEVRFPKRNRILDIAYCSGNSDSLRACLQPYIAAGRLEVILNTPVKTLYKDHLVLENGDAIDAPSVLDARGFEPNENVFLGYQKFVGHVIRTKKPHDLEYPIIMDATVKQLGGYRFVYCLPFSKDEILVEDTYYTDGSELPEREISDHIMDYIHGQGWEVAELLRTEKGVLPITLAVGTDAYPDHALGIRGGRFHAVTGYSFPAVMREADALAITIKNERVIDENGHVQLPITCGSFLVDGRSHAQKERFFRLLNRMLFRAAKPEQRYKVLERFYGLSEGLIKRFYASELTWLDKLRILSGKPPVPIHLALYNFSEKAFIKRERAKRTAKDE